MLAHAQAVIRHWQKPRYGTPTFGIFSRVVSPVCVTKTK
jgi:hypothetical protein